MKNIFKLILSVSIFASCGTTAPPNTGEITSSSQRMESITIVAKGYGKKEALAIAHAKEQAFINLLFRGIPNTSYSNGGMIGKEVPSREANPKYFKPFFEGNGLDRFVIKTRIMQAFSKKDKSVKCEVIINTRSLRNDLTQNGVIREFGF